MITPPRFREALRARSRPLLVASATGALIAAISASPGEGSFATPPPSPPRNSSYCIGDLLSCCLGSRSPDSDDMDDQLTFYSRQELTSDRPLRRPDAPAVPTRLYLASLRPPSHVFVDGIFADRLGMNLVNFILDGGEGAFTTPTASPLVAYDAARALGNLADYQNPQALNLTRPSSVWIYEIRADSTFFDVDESLRWILAHPGGSHAFRSREDRHALYSAGLSRRWATIGIPVENIRVAYAISRNTPRPSCPNLSPAEGGSESISGQAAELAHPFPIDSAEHNRRYISLNTRGSNQLLTD